MMTPAAPALSEDDLDLLVSIAIRRAEALDALGSPSADAWAEVMAFEERLADITSPADVPGGIARVGAVSAALAAGRRSDARRLADCYRAEPGLPPERHAAIERVFERDDERRARRFPALARNERLREISDWQATAAEAPHIFPIAP